jgi:outer membrane lipoprotein LolB
MRQLLIQWRYAFISLGLIGLISCASIPASAPPADQTLTWEERQQQLSRLTHWSLNGAMSIRSAGEATSASINWQQQNNNYQIRLFGPLGAGQIQLTGTPTGATLIMQQDTVSASSPEQLFLQQTGWYMPVTNLLYWVRGIPAPYSAARVERDEYGRARIITQDGWTVRYERFTAVKGNDLPTKIQLSSDDRQIRFVVNRWRI